MNINRLTYDELVQCLTQNITPTTRKYVLMKLTKINDGLIEQESDYYNNQSSVSNSVSHSLQSSQLSQPSSLDFSSSARIGQYSTKRKDLTEQKHPAMTDDGSMIGKTESYFRDVNSGPIMNQNQARTAAQYDRNFWSQPLNQIQAPPVQPHPVPSRRRAPQPESDEDLDDIFDELDLDSKPESSKDELDDTLDIISSLYSSIHKKKLGKSKKRS